MSDNVTIPRKQYECLRRHLSEAQKIFETLRVEEQKAPEPSEKESRVQKWLDKL